MPMAGARLRQAREQAGLTLHDVAKQTKIQRWILTAIEEGDLSRVPGGIFIRGYVTAYARAVGLDDERLWAGPAPKRTRGLLRRRRSNLLRRCAAAGRCGQLLPSLPRWL